jgi:hypothetical protein
MFSLQYLFCLFLCIFIKVSLPWEKLIHSLVYVMVVIVIHRFDKQFLSIFRLTNFDIHCLSLKALDPLCLYICFRIITIRPFYKCTIFFVIKYDVIWRILFLQQMILRNPFNEETNFYLK